MKTALSRRSAAGPIDPGYLFGIAWLAAFLGVVLIIAAVVWAMAAFA